MKYTNISVPTTGNITPYEIHRAIANREEYLKGMPSVIPKIVNQKTNVKLKEGPGLWSFITGCLP